MEAFLNQAVGDRMDLLPDLLRSLLKEEKQLGGKVRQLHFS